MADTQPAQSRVALYVPAVARTGVSANQALLYLRGEWEHLQPGTREALTTAGLGQVEVGMTPRRQTFLRLFSEAKAFMARREQVATAATNRLPQASEISKWPANRPGGFLYHTLVALERPGGEVYFTQSAFFTAQLVTFERAAAEAAAVYFEAQARDESFSGERLLGPGFVTGVSEFTALDDE